MKNQSMKQLMRDIFSALDEYSIIGPFALALSVCVTWMSVAGLIRTALPYYAIVFFATLAFAAANVLFMFVLTLPVVRRYQYTRNRPYYQYTRRA